MRAAQPTVQISTVEGDRSEAQRVLLSSTPCVQEEPDPQRRPTVRTSERCQPQPRAQPTVQISTVEGDRSEAKRVLFRHVLKKV